jgi:hypothetical protein
MKCLETRTRAGLRYRRYRTEDGVTVRTVEVPLEVWTTIVKAGRARDRIAEYTRRQQRVSLRVSVEALLTDGWKPIAAAHAHGIPLRTVQRWAHELRS